MSDHELKIKAYSKAFQRLRYNRGAFDIVEEEILHRQRAIDVECTCGETFDRGGWEVSDAKKHLKNVAWEAENLDDNEVPLRRGDRIQLPENDDHTDWCVKDVDGKHIEVHMGNGVLPIDEREEVRSAIEKSREAGPVRVLDADGNEKDI